MNFCTVFDEHYYAKGRALIASIQRWCGDSEIYVLDASANQDLQIPDVALSRLLEVESPELIIALTNRSHKEFMWTLASFWTWYLLADGLDEICYVDSDTFFFYSDQSLWQEIGDKAIAITEHRWTPALKANLVGNGRFNVGLVYFKQAGLPCLTHWKDQVLEWCYDSHADERFGDQAYLDDWVERWGAYVIQSNGINLAPWNQLHLDYCIDENGVMFVEDGDRCDVLAHYHFSEFDTYSRGRKIWTNYELHPMIAKYVYATYQAEITKWSSVARTAERTYA